MKKELNDCTNTSIVAARVAKSAVFNFGKNTRRFEFILGVGNLKGGVTLYFFIALKKSEERLNRVYLTRDRFGGVVFIRKLYLESINVISGDLLRSGFAGSGDEI